MTDRCAACRTKFHNLSEVFIDDGVTVHLCSRCEDDLNEGCRYVEAAEAKKLAQKAKERALPPYLRVVK